MPPRVLVFAAGRPGDELQSKPIRSDSSRRAARRSAAVARRAGSRPALWSQRGIDGHGRSDFRRNRAGGHDPGCVRSGDVQRRARRRLLPAIRRRRVRSLHRAVAAPRLNRLVAVQPGEGSGVGRTDHRREQSRWRGPHVHRGRGVRRRLVPMLNELSGNAKVAPECMALDDDDFVAPGARYQEVLDDDGTVRFQCCIHPWMRLEARVKER